MQVARRVLARSNLDRFRAPLCAATDDLGSRINNMRHDRFLLYLRTERRREASMRTALFRFAQFFGWTEIVHGHADRLRFEAEENTSKVAACLREIARTLALDRLDRSDPSDFTSTRLMLWREDQGGIGEAMRAEDDPPRCLGYDSFLKLFEERFASYFTAFTDDLRPEWAPQSERLAILQRLLAGLLVELDVDRRVTRHGPNGVAEPRWARASMYPPASQNVQQ
jgi:hypothetical protein